jgi:hypothetical protein
MKAGVTVNAGDDALYTPRRGEPVVVRVWGHTAKRVGIIFTVNTMFKVRYVKPERLERRGGGC